ncbi:thiol peroxidase (atypical 2-Cys peroxiredoxin) [Gelidibacter sediminis]|uniref:Thiol peroxidase n=1 Tax=Gelidibacter sediminis TaxID=1608710 RepID=A0A4R7PZF0_9FLAO|nr:thiol peroxidase [Gelidibacter sediminis]TDU40398.1 thiol peroxidase (atypical 2-Cys peroxiredoxin) [Gelidibacter sediminis]
MATVTLKGNPVTTSGELPKTGVDAPNFKLVATDLSSKSLNDYLGSTVVLNIFPSVDTGTCAQSVRTFNEKASQLDNTKVLCISKDLPFALSRFCAAEGLENVESLSDFRDGNFGKSYGLTFVDGPLEGLHSRCVVVLNKDAEVIYTEQVSEITEEPNYEAALNSLS